MGIYMPMHMRKCMQEQLLKKEIMNLMETSEEHVRRIWKEEKEGIDVITL